MTCVCGQYDSCKCSTKSTLRETAWNVSKVVPVDNGTMNLEIYSPTTGRKARIVGCSLTVRDPNTTYEDHDLSGVLLAHFTEHKFDLAISYQYVEEMTSEPLLPDA